MKEETKEGLSKYENAKGLIKFSIEDAKIGVSCFCCKKKVGASDFSNFQDKADEIKMKPFKRV